MSSANQKTNQALIALGVVSVGVLGYLIWIFLAPPPAVPAAEEAKLSVDVPAETVGEKSPFHELKPYANLPVIVDKVGRSDPFSPFVIENNIEKILDKTDAGSNTSAGGQTAPEPISEPSPVPAAPENANTNSPAGEPAASPVELPFPIVNYPQ
jgi:hypothetical protein